MKRVSKVYRGQDIYGEVELRNIYRSRIAQIAEYIDLNPISLEIGFYY